MGRSEELDEEGNKWECSGRGMENLAKKRSSSVEELGRGKNRKREEKTKDRGIKFTFVSKHPHKFSLVISPISIYL